MIVQANCWTFKYALQNQWINYIFVSGIKKNSSNFSCYFVSEKQTQRLQTSPTNTCDVNFIWNVCSLLRWYLTDAFWSSNLWWRSQTKEHHNQNLCSKYKRYKLHFCRTIIQYQVCKFFLFNNCHISWQLLYQLDCKRRILLTGTPIQNDLQEFYALIDFTNPGVLGSSTGICLFWCCDIGDLDL